MKRNTNLYTKKVKLNKVADNKQKFSLTGRSKSVLYNLQSKEAGTALITSLSSGLSFYRSPKIWVFIAENCK